MMEELKALLQNQITVTTRLIDREGQMLKAIEGTLTDHEKRIRVVERLLAYGAGAVGVGLYVLKALGKI